MERIRRKKESNRKGEKKRDMAAHQPTKHIFDMKAFNSVTYAQTTIKIQ